MSYVSKTDWQYNEVLTETDMNRIEVGIAEGNQMIHAHTADLNNPHGVTIEQIGAETPSGAQAKVDAHATNPSGSHDAQAISFSDPHFTATNVGAALPELFSSVSSGKSQLATAIAGKGGTVAGTAPHSFQTLVNGVNSILTPKNEAFGSGAPLHAVNTPPPRQTIGLAFTPSRVIVVLKHQNGNYNAPDTIAIVGFSELTQFAGANNSQSSGQGKSSYGYLNITLQENGFYFDTTLTSTGSSVIANSTTYKWWAMK